MFAVMHKTPKSGSVATSTIMVPTTVETGHLYSSPQSPLVLPLRYGLPIEDVTQHQRDNRHGNLGNFSRTAKPNAVEATKMTQPAATTVPVELPVHVEPVSHVPNDQHIGGNGNPAEQTYRHQNVNGMAPFSPNEYFTMPYVGRRAFLPR